MLCKRIIQEREYDQWLREYERVMKMDSGRESSMERIFELIENNLVLIGSTAIEDKLQTGVCNLIILTKVFRGDNSIHERSRN